MEVWFDFFSVFCRLQTWRQRFWWRWHCIWNIFPEFRWLRISYSKRNMQLAQRVRSVQVTTVNKYILSIHDRNHWKTGDQGANYFWSSVYECPEIRPEIPQIRPEIPEFQPEIPEIPAIHETPVFRWIRTKALEPGWKALKSNVKYMKSSKSDVKSLGYCLKSFKSDLKYLKSGQKPTRI